jgi:hypothetical protein
MNNQVDKSTLGFRLGYIFISITYLGIKQARSLGIKYGQVGQASEFILGLRKLI